MALLIDRGAALDKSDSDGNTPLMAAASVRIYASANRI